jgi:hypothetical protein
MFFLEGGGSPRGMLILSEKFQEWKMTVVFPLSTGTMQMFLFSCNFSGLFLSDGQVWVWEDVPSSECSPFNVWFLLQSQMWGGYWELLLRSQSLLLIAFRCNGSVEGSYYGAGDGGIQKELDMWTTVRCASDLGSGDELSLSGRLTFCLCLVTLLLNTMSPKHFSSHPFRTSWYSKHLSSHPLINHVVTAYWIALRSSVSSNHAFTSQSPPTAFSVQSFQPPKTLTRW